MNRKPHVLAFVSLQLVFPLSIASLPARAIEIRPSDDRSIVQTAAPVLDAYRGNTGLSDKTWDGYPLLKRICATESNDGPNSEPIQFDPGTQDDPRWGWEASSTAPGGKIRVKRDVGACQINTIAHADEIAHLHLDVVHSFADNVAYAKLLFDREGWKPWEPSKTGWDPHGLIH